METIKDLVSVIIPTYSRPDYIVRAVESVLCQTYDNVELIVVDDNGLNNCYQIQTETLLKPYVDDKKIIYLVHETNKNGSAARNTGVRASKGDFITFLDDDDVIYPDKIRKELIAIKSVPGYDAVYCGYRIIRNCEVLKTTNVTQKGNLQYELLASSWGFGTGSNPLFSRRVFEEIGLFDESFVRFQDVEFMVRFFRKFKIQAVNEILIDRFIDSRINSLNANSLYNVLQKFLATFHYDIHKYGNRAMRTICRNRYADIGFHALMEKNYSFAWEMYKMALSYKMISPRIIAKAMACILFDRRIE